jgi:hypothetical protein
LHYSERAGYEAALEELQPAVADEQLLTIDLLTGGTGAELHELLGRLERAGASAHRVSAGGPSLDEVFLSLTATRAEEVAR